MKCSWLKREGLEGEDNDFLGILKSITSYNCPCLFFEGFINHSILSILSVPAVMEVDGGGSGRAGTGEPWYPPCVSLGSEVCCPLPAQASELVLRITVFEASFPHLLWCVYLSHPCSKQFLFLMPCPHSSPCPAGIWPLDLAVIWGSFLIYTERCEDFVFLCLGTV